MTEEMRRHIADYHGNDITDIEAGVDVSVTKETPSIAIPLSQLSRMLSLSLSQNKEEVEYYTFGLELKLTGDRVKLIVDLNK